MAKKKSFKSKSTLLVLLIILIILGFGWFLLFSNSEYSGNNNIQENSVVDDKQDRNKEFDKQKAEVGENKYQNQSVGLSFDYLANYKITEDNLSSGQKNSRLIYRNDNKNTQLIVYANVEGPDPTLADFQYLMNKSNNVFKISEKREGFIPVANDDGSFSVIADFGVSPGTDKIANKKFLFVWNSKVDNKYLQDFESILLSIREM